MITTKVLRDKVFIKIASTRAALPNAMPWFARQFDRRAPSEKTGWPKIAASRAPNRWARP